MRKNSREFRFHGYSVQHKEVIGFKNILFCTCKGRGDMEIVFEKAVAIENEELLWYNRILFVEVESVGKNKQNRYTFFYQDTKITSVINAESMDTYSSSYFIGAIGRYAAKEWNKRHICLPSLMTAILMLETDNGKNLALEIGELVKVYTDYLVVWKTEGTMKENEKFPWGQDNYILAVQYLQEAVNLYFGDRKIENLLISTIEENRLTRFDF